MDINETSYLNLRHNLTDMMSRLNHLSGFIHLVLTVFAVPGLNMELKQCRGVDLDITEDHVMHMNDCLKAAGAKDVKDIASEKLSCFGKCVFAKKGLIDEKGKPHKEKIMSLITDRMPKAVHEDLNKRITTCLKPDTTDIIDNEDESCTTYLPFLMCFHMSFLEECADDDD